MKVAFINGSPRKGNTASGYLLERLEKKLPGCEIVPGWGEPCDAYVFAFPLYVDGIPSNLLRELVEHEQDMLPGARVYVLVNNGFYEGEQNAAAISMMRSWCARAGLLWGQALAVGGGGALLLTTTPMGKLLGRGAVKKRNLALDILAGHILTGDGGEDIICSPNMPRALYMRGGDAGFRLEGKKNGLTKQEMERHAYD